MEEVLTALDLKPGDDVVDATLGGGGHASALLEAIGPTGRLLGIEWDARTLEETRKKLERFGSRAMLVHGNYRNLEHFAQACGIPSFSAILLDLGFSSFQIDDPERGFSLRHDGPLDMRYDASGDLTASDIVNGWSKEDLIRILREYGEERAAGRIADTIIHDRRQFMISSTAQLAAIVASAVPERFRGGKPKIHPATQTFQALRIAVNDELGNVESVLPEALKLLKPGGRLAVISFHSLEDRIVKRFFEDSKELTSLTAKPMTPGRNETLANPRSRSAKLRIARKN
jgi:16S rRNA (cytosine1402-N4)-methyltransferase